jgi:hypothetical protein
VTAVPRDPISRGAAGGDGEPGERLGAEVVIVWALLALVTVCVAVTYARLPVSQLYHVSQSGIGGGLSRALVLVGFPIALVAIALALVAFDFLGGSVAALLATVSVVLSAFVAWPGVVDQANLDAKALNAVPATGVVLAAALAAWAAKRGMPAFSGRLRFDAARLALAIVLVIVSLPWLFAEAGFSVSDLPGLRELFLGDQVRATGGGETLQVVHLGHHHGADGLYLAVSALVLSRLLPRLGKVRILVSAYLALMLAYGLANLLQDFWTEQIVKRGWTDREIPSLLHPSLSLGWALIFVVAAAVEVCFFRRERRLVLGEGARN